MSLKLNTDQNPITLPTSSPSQEGLMSAADKTKLDALAAVLVAEFTLTQAEVVALGAVASGSVSTGITIPAGARFLGATVGEGSGQIGLNDAGGTGTWSAAVNGIGVGGGSSSTANVKVGQTFPKTLAISGGVFVMGPISGALTIFVSVTGMGNILSGCNSGANLTFKLFYTLGPA